MELKVETIYIFPQLHENIMLIFQPMFIQHYHFCSWLSVKVRVRVRVAVGAGVGIGVRVRVRVRTVSWLRGYRTIPIRISGFESELPLLILAAG